MPPLPHQPRQPLPEHYKKRQVGERMERGEGGWGGCGGKVRRAVAGKGPPGGGASKRQLGPDPHLGTLNQALSPPAHINLN